MENNLNSLLNRVRSSAELIGDRTGKAYKNAADNAGKKAADVVASTKLNLKIFDLNAEIDQIYKEIGKMVYDIHLGVEEDEEELNHRLDLIDEKIASVESLREKIKDIKAEPVCPSCGRACKKTDTFCSGCGAQL